MMFDINQFYSTIRDFCIYYKVAKIGNIDSKGFYGCKKKNTSRDLMITGSKVRGSLI